MLKHILKEETRQGHDTLLNSMLCELEVIYCHYYIRNNIIYVPLIGHDYPKYLGGLMSRKYENIHACTSFVIYNTWKVTCNTAMYRYMYTKQVFLLLLWRAKPQILTILICHRKMINTISGDGSINLLPRFHISPYTFRKAASRMSALDTF